MNEYTVTYYEPVSDENTESYITKGLRDARAELLAIMGYNIIIPEGD